MPSGTTSSWSSSRVRRSESRWKVTRPEVSDPSSGLPGEAVVIALVDDLRVPVAVDARAGQPAGQEVAVALDVLDTAGAVG